MKEAVKRHIEVSLNWSNIFSYLSKEHSFIHVSLRQSHRPPKSLKVKDSSWSEYAVQLQVLKNNVLEEVVSRRCCTTIQQNECSIIRQLLV